MLDIGHPVRAALAAGAPVVALESTLITHGLPWPANLETARAAEAAIRGAGATPATIAVWNGVPTIGLGDAELEALARAPDVLKASGRDLAAAVARKAHAGTTVAATLQLAHQAGIQVFATGGIGGVHPPEAGQPVDVSADLYALARIPVAVVCAGAKNILDLPATLEVLEALGVPVLSVGSGEFPAFYLRSSGLPAPERVESARAAAALARTHWRLGGAGGVLVALPLPEESALDPASFAAAAREARRLARVAGVQGARLTPFLLARLAELTDGATLRANRALVAANAALAAQLARALSEDA